MLLENIAKIAGSIERLMKQGFFGIIAVMVLLCSLTAVGVLTYVESRHRPAVANIGQNSEDIQSLKDLEKESKAKLEILVNSMQTLSDTLKEVKEDTKVTRQRVWDLRESYLKRRDKDG